MACFWVDLNSRLETGLPMTGNQAQILGVTAAPHAQRMFNAECDRDRDVIKIKSIATRSTKISLSIPTQL